MGTVKTSMTEPMFEIANGERRRYRPGKRLKAVHRIKRLEGALSLKQVANDLANNGSRVAQDWLRLKLVA